MSATVIAYAIIGSKVNRCDFFVQTERSPHESCTTVGPGPCCQSCGRSIHEVIVESNPVNGFEAEGGNHYRGRIGGLDLIEVSPSKDCFLVFDYNKVERWDDVPWGSKRLYVNKMGEAQDKLRSILKPLNLWDPESFGVWVAQEYGS